MSLRGERAGHLALTLVTVAALAGCGSQGQLEFSNLGPGAAVVDTGDQAASRVEEHGGVLLLDYECTPGDVRISFEDGSSTVVLGPICSDQRVVIKDGAATVKPARADG